MEILDDYILEEETLSEKEADWQLFIGDRFEYYLPIWRKIENGKKAHFNGWGFIFSAGWAAYRKLYSFFFILFFINTSFDYIPYFLGLYMGNLSTILSLSFFLIWGFYANYIYYTQATKKIAAIKAARLSKVLEQKAIRDAGGTDLATAVGLSVILTILNMLLQSFLYII